MTPTTAKIDIPLILGRLCPTAEFHWKGNGWGTYAEIGEWRSPDIPKPSEAEVYAEWDKHLAEMAVAGGKAAEHRSKIDTATKGIDGLHIEDLQKLPLEQMRSLLAGILDHLGMIAPDGRIVLSKRE